MPGERMKKISFKVESDLCDDCSLALRRFIGHIEGVESIEAEDGKIIIDFNDSKISKEDLNRITRNSMEKLGYKLIE
jgi:copper chaperone CopZ